MVTTRSLSSRCLRSAHVHPHSAPTARTFSFLLRGTESRQPRTLCFPVSLLVLDFLAPATISSSASASASRYPTPPTGRGLSPLFGFRSTSRSSSTSTSTSILPLASRPFSHGSIHRQTEARSPSQTVAIHNPRQDDNGEDMAVEITPRAARRLKEIMINDANPHLALRITVESGGCHGFQYLMSLTTLNMSTAGSDIVSSGEDGEDDTVFEATDGSEAKVVMDGPSLELLKGSKIDYTMELIGSQFKIVDNPLATSSCGCGTSFDIKI